MNSTIDAFPTIEKMPEAPSYWADSQEVSELGVELDFERPFPMARPEVARLADHMPFPIVAGVTAGDTSFVVVDSRGLDRYTPPFYLIQDGEGSGYRGIWPNTPLTIGRGHHEDRFQYAPSVSREHFTLLFDEATNTLTLSDLSSTNGTFVTGYVSEASEQYNDPSLRFVRAIFTPQVAEGLREYFDIGQQDETAPNGMYKNHHIIGRQSTTVRDGVYGTLSSEHIVVDDKNVIVQQAVESAMRSLEAQGGAATLDYRTVLRLIGDQTDMLLTYDLKKTEELSKPHYDTNGLINLSEYLHEGVGVCRHQALLAALCMEEAIARGYLYGTVAVERNHDLQRDAAHAWAVLHRDGQESLILDATNHFVGTREEAKKQGRWRYLVPEVDE